MKKNMMTRLQLKHWRIAATAAGVVAATVAGIAATTWAQPKTTEPAGTMAAPATAAAEVRRISPRADGVFRAACKYLADAPHFSVKVEIWEDVVLPIGQKIQTTKTLDVHEQRPNRLHIESQSPRFSRGFWYRDKTFTLLDRANNVYGVVEAPDTIDATIDAVEDRFGIELPLADVLVADPYKNMMDIATTADYLGKVKVMGVVCHHLAFTSPAMDSQLWIADGPHPLLKKVVLNDKTKVGSPQVTAIFSDWDLVSPISGSVFEFVPPVGAAKIAVERQPADEQGTPGATQPAAISPR